MTLIQNETRINQNNRYLLQIKYYRYYDHCALLCFCHSFVFAPNHFFIILDILYSFPLKVSHISGPRLYQTFKTIFFSPNHVSQLCQWPFWLWQQRSLWLARGLFWYILVFFKIVIFVLVIWWLWKIKGEIKITRKLDQTIKTLCLILWCGS